MYNGAHRLLWTPFCLSRSISKNDPAYLSCKDDNGCAPNRRQGKRWLKKSETQGNKYPILKFYKVVVNASRICSENPMQSLDKVNAKSIPKFDI